MHRSLALFLLCVATNAIPARSVTSQQNIDLPRLQSEAVQRTREYLRINTANPPGNEVASMRWFAGILKQEGIPFDTLVSAPGRGNIWARLKGGSEPALVLLHHMDVVPADAKYWDSDPFAATTKDSVIFGRGTLDTKSLGVVQLQTFLALKRAKVPLNRDVIFMATADEEAGGNFGAGWIVKNRPEAFKGAGLLLNEGGAGTANEDGRIQFAIEVTQKTPLWLKLTAVGNPGHGSQPPTASAVNRLLRALDRLQTHEFAPRVVPAVGAYFAAIAPAMPARWRESFGDAKKLIANRNTLTELQIDRRELAALLRNTCSITMLQASSKINVIPAEAQAQVDCRLLPDEDRAAFLREFTAVLNDPDIKIDQIIGFAPAVSSTETPLYTAIVAGIRRNYPGASIAPAVQTGFTDSHWFRALGIASYGFDPFVIPHADESGLHGNNERISIENIKKGTAIMLEIVSSVVHTR
ncbi:MAG TPA: M20/M25/M40 family metallo-hydrolase [Gemmatimonadaceae bacterium]|nr:M20/M25/M40 family metallo-hydrolase [Gemmatimonadaceae bacterium]